MVDCVRLNLNEPVWCRTVVSIFNDLVVRTLAAFINDDMDEFGHRQTSPVRVNG